MGPQMNANTRKCKSHHFVSGVHITGMTCVLGHNNKRIQINYSRLFAFICG